jgi:hypothetical protein
MGKSGLSKRAKGLLQAGEGSGVDYKQNIESIKADDLCAFANMPFGGSILAGVVEHKRRDGSTFGVPIECLLTDQSQLDLLNKAQQCHPPIALTFHKELAGVISFTRIEILPSDTRPHCTAAGRYVTRAESRNVPILPPALLSMFLEREGREFQKRFQESTAGITSKISETAESVEALQKRIEDRIEDISSQLGWSDMMFDDTGSKIDDLDALIRELIRRAVDSGSRLRHLAEGTGSKDPIKQRAKENVRETIKKELLENLDTLKRATTGSNISYKISGELAEELSKGELQEIFGDVIKEILPLQAAKAAKPAPD